MARKTLSDAERVANKAKRDRIVYLENLIADKEVFEALGKRKQTEYQDELSVLTNKGSSGKRGKSATVFDADKLEMLVKLAKLEIGATVKYDGKTYTKKSFGFNLKLENEKGEVVSAGSIEKFN